jgi:hypothetical protein
MPSSIDGLPLIVVDRGRISVQGLAARRFSDAETIGIIE